MKKLQGKKALLTGAASGIGRALARELAGAGVNLALIDVDASGLANVKNELSEFNITVLTMVCDVSDQTEILKTCNTLREIWGELDILINNAGVAYYGSTHNMTADQWDWLMDINLRAPIHFTHELLPLLMEKPEAHIMNVCSIAGLVTGGRSTAYHVSKFGLVGFSEALRAEYGRRGIGVTALCPGPVKTKLYRKAVCGKSRKSVPEPPSILCCSEELVAKKAIKGIRKNKRMVLVTPMAYFLYYVKRFSPGLIDFFQQFSRGKVKSYFSPPKNIEDASDDLTTENQKAA